MSQARSWQERVQTVGVLLLIQLEHLLSEDLQPASALRRMTVGNASSCIVRVLHHRAICEEKSALVHRQGQITEFTLKAFR